LTLRERAARLQSENDRLRGQIKAQEGSVAAAAAASERAAELERECLRLRGAVRALRKEKVKGKGDEKREGEGEAANGEDQGESARSGQGEAVEASSMRTNVRDDPNRARGLLDTANEGLYDADNHPSLSPADSASLAAATARNARLEERLSLSEGTIARLKAELHAAAAAKAEAEAALAMERAGVRVMREEDATQRRKDAVQREEQEEKWRAEVAAAEARESEWRERCNEAEHALEELQRSVAERSADMVKAYDEGQGQGQRRVERRLVELEAQNQLLAVKVRVIDHLCFGYRIFIAIS